MDSNILIKEQCGSVGNIIAYTSSGRNEIICINPKRTITAPIHFILHFLREVLLPYGYPESVSEDYLEYQLWDTAQAFCSTITGAFTTRAVLKGVGVGDSEATALSAAITWIMKEGTGMLGRIIFAWWKGSGLDSDCKKWRLFADILNDVAMSIELLLPFIGAFSMQILCVTSVMKSIVGIAGGATRASITNHQAIKNNMAEISAKDGTQETVVNLVASIASIYLLNIFNGTFSEWIFIFSLMALHLLTNYWAVKSLIFRNLNDQRLAIVLRTYLTVGTIMNPKKTNEKEVVILGFGRKVSDFCGFKIVMGMSLKKVLHTMAAAEFLQTLALYKTKNYFLIVDISNGTIYISFEKGEYPESVIAAYFHAVVLGIATCIYNGMDLDIYSKRQLHHRTPITRLYTFMKSFDKSSTYQNIPYEHLVDFEEFLKKEYSMFHTALQLNDWVLTSHTLNVGEWRTEWKSYDKKLN
ncbi:RUS family member 1 [Leptinotarsa decemlineata]|uniref:RUS family member 1 n=1 Tax=Leptinotarsa decemlineata TaxID=7539 RepID=UPI003D306685